MIFGLSFGRGARITHFELHEKKTRATISVLKIYIGMTSKIILKVLLSNPMLELK